LGNGHQIEFQMIKILFSHDRNESFNQLIDAHKAGVRGNNKCNIDPPPWTNFQKNLAFLSKKYWQKSEQTPHMDVQLSASMDQLC
jgi:hypothetical protein